MRKRKGVNPAGRRNREDHGGVEGRKSLNRVYEENNPFSIKLIKCQKYLKIRTLIKTTLLQT